VSSAGAGGGAPLVVHHALLRSASSGFDDVGDALEAAVTTLENALAAEKGRWGADEPGESFAHGYEPAAEQATGRFRELVHGLHELRASLVEAAAVLHGTEDTNTGALGGRT
jgi:hypothetical protein